MARSSSFRLPHLSILLLLLMSFWFLSATVTAEDTCLRTQDCLSWVCFGVCPAKETVKVYDKTGTEHTTYLEYAKLMQMKAKGGRRCCAGCCGRCSSYCTAWITWFLAPLLIGAVAALHTIEQENRTTASVETTTQAPQSSIVTIPGSKGTSIIYIDPTLGPTEWVYAQDVIGQLLAEYGWIIGIEFLVIVCCASVYAATRINQKKKAFARDRKSSSTSGDGGAANSKQPKKPKKAPKVVSSLANSMISAISKAFSGADSKVESDDDDDDDIEAARKADKKQKKKKEHKKRHHHAKSPKRGRSKS